MITLFVDNLPDDVSLRWVRYFFNKFGVVKDVFIPAKRSKAMGRVFAFVKYDCTVSTEMAISKSNGLWVEERKLFVKKSSFDQNKGKDKLKINLIKNNAGNISYNKVGGEVRNDVSVPMKNSKSELVGKGFERLDTLSSGYANLMHKLSKKLIPMAVPDSSPPLMDEDDDDDDDELDEHVETRMDLPTVKEYNVSTQNGVNEDDGELLGSMYVQTTDTLGTTSKWLNNQQILQDNGQSKGITLMVDLNISQRRIEGLSESLARGKMEV
ncbi:hypothetical protein RHMOL_Rhmol11G0064800 [Rhododendron molle]|uniref:Uncharacterized protein n=1 Tax=Rhododendron molle TaxID=49168 RepID=A0ACC0LQG0_RHOML|nr:hypothetical protein RHMOL_Rhmol11G0064800 [Rhododendron molle]